MSYRNYLRLSINTHGKSLSIHFISILSIRRNDGTEIASAVPSEVLCTIWTTSRHLAHYEQHDAHELLIALLDTLGSHLQFNHGDHNLIQLIPNTAIESEPPISLGNGVSHSPRSWSEEIKDSTHEVSHCLHTDSVPREDSSDEHQILRPSSVAPSFPHESTVGLDYIFRGIVNEVCLPLCDLLSFTFSRRHSPVC